MTKRGAMAAAVAMAIFLAPRAQAQPDLDVQRLEEQLVQLDSDPTLAEAAGLDRLRARQAIEALRKAGRKDRDSALRVAEMRVETARLAAQTVPLVDQSRGLDSDRDAILIEASRLDAQKARREAELMRMQALAREEDAEREAIAAQQQTAQAMADTQAATEEAAQARRLADARAREADLARQEAELAAQVLKQAEPAPESLLDPESRSGKTVYVLAGMAFAGGKASLTPAAREALGKLATRLKATKGKIRIVGHTDSQGSDSANQALSLQRAQAVRVALLHWGIAASRLQAVGMGEREPRSSNETSAGRARNRRIEISLD